MGLGGVGGHFPEVNTADPAHPLFAILAQALFVMKAESAD